MTVLLVGICPDASQMLKINRRDLSGIKNCDANLSVSDLRFKQVDPGNLMTSSLTYKLTWLTCQSGNS